MFKISEIDINKNKMITTKGYFYFEHLNPKHNIKARKIRPLSIENNNTNELPS